ncbi:MAG: saccharopine dehydrogenase NADP-binding domain-containing protein [Chloroflexales bacterium]|nr:saccharopine dehydrogenase NADP-binding domain-containing protein [Chloroflexales bacterium]
MSKILLYGANGYTGALIARAAVQQGLRPTLAGRNTTEISRLANELGLEYQIFNLENRAMLDMVLASATVVLHCAGPFAHTSKLMAEGCLRTRTHYLDITGEVAVFESLAARDTEAKAVGVMLLPGAGFDVVPSDCLAAHLKVRLPDANYLALGFRALGQISRGTANTAVENLHRGSLVRRDGVLTPIPTGAQTREIDFGRGPVAATAIPWGDVSTAFYSTGIPNIEVYTVFPPVMRWVTVASRPLGRLLSTYADQRLLKYLVSRQPPGPTETQRARGRAILWGEVRNPAGVTCVSRLYTPESYALTVQTALAIATKVLNGQAPVGFQTPSLAYGANFILEIDGVKREDLN